VIPEILKWYGEKSQDNPIIAILGLFPCICLALYMALVLKLRGDKKYKELL